jgi:cytochrome P450
MAFWVVAHLVYDPNLMEQIRQEVLPAIRGNTIDDRFLSEQCPKLDSLIGETLRLTVASSLARVVTDSCLLSGKILHPGNKIMVSCQLDPAHMY